MRERLQRPLFCPVCGAGLWVDVANGGQYPETHILPDHTSANGMNLCAAVGITVTFDFVVCRGCDARISKHPSGLCLRCYEATSPDRQPPPGAQPPR